MSACRCESIVFLFATNGEAIFAIRKRTGFTYNLLFSSLFRAHPASSACFSFYRKLFLHIHELYLFYFLILRFTIQIIHLCYLIFQIHASHYFSVQNNGFWWGGILFCTELISPPWQLLKIITYFEPIHLTKRILLSLPKSLVSPFLYSSGMFLLFIQVPTATKFRSSNSER